MRRQRFICRFVADAANVVFVGGVGTGKTHLSIALGMACRQHDYRVRFVTAAELVTLLVEAQQQGRLARKLARLARFDAIILDELGYVPFDKAGADDPRCRPRQRDRVLAGVQARRCAPPPLRGADGLDAGCAHGHRQITSDNPETRFIQGGHRFDRLTETGGSLFTWPQGSLFQLPFPNSHESHRRTGSFTVRSTAESSEP